jgi:hypothetical protein
LNVAKDADWNPPLRGEEVGATRLSCFLTKHGMSTPPAPCEPGRLPPQAYQGCGSLL